MFGKATREGINKRQLQRLLSETYGCLIANCWNGNGNGNAAMGKRGVLAAKGRFKGSKGSEGGPNCSTSQTSDRRTILAQLRHPKVRKHTPAPLEPPPASTNAVGRVTTSTKKHLGDALISLHLQFTRTNQKRPRTTLPTPPSFPPSPPQRQRPPSHISVQQHYPTRQGQKVSEKPVLPVPTSPVAAIASIKQQHPHLIACPEFFLSSISPSPSLSIPRQPLVCRPLPPLIPPPPYKRTQPPSWATPTPTSSRSTRSASWLCVLPLIPQQFLAASPRPRHSVGVAALPHHQWRGGKKKRQWCSLHRTTAMRGVG